MKIFSGTPGGGSGGGSSNSFQTMQPITGTTPTASSATDTLTFTSSDSTVSIIGNSGTKTLDFKAVSGSYTPGVSADWASVPTTTTGGLDSIAATGIVKAQTANKVMASATSGGSAVMAPRALVGADLPNPSTTTLGGIQAIVAVTSNWIRSISTSGVPALSQPAFTDISGSVAASQLPNPSSSTLGGIQSLAAVTSKWINTISTSGVPTATQPALSDMSDTYVKGDTLQASATNVLGKTAIGAQGQLPVVQSSGVWAWTDFFNPSTTVAFYDDFIGQSPPSATGGLWSAYNTGTNSLVLNGVFNGAGANWSNAYPGVMSIRTGTTTTGGSCLYGSERSAIMSGGGITSYEVNVAFTAASDATNTYNSCFGFQSFSSGSPNTVPTDGFYFSYTHSANSGKILFNVSKASTITSVDTGITPSANTFVRLGFVSNSAGTSYQLYVNGVSTGSAVTTNIPLATVGLSFAHFILKSAGTTSRDLAVDYVKFQMQMATAR